MPQITDQSTMPFGMHKGKKTINVPAKYLLAILDKGWIVDEDVKRYVLDNIAVLKKEAGQR